LFAIHDSTGEPLTTAPSKLLLLLLLLVVLASFPVSFSSGAAAATERASTWTTNEYTALSVIVPGPAPCCARSLKRTFSSLFRRFAGVRDVMRCAHLPLCAITTQSCVPTTFPDTFTPHDPSLSLRFSPLLGDTHASVTTLVWRSCFVAMKVAMPPMPPPRRDPIHRGTTSAPCSSDEYGVNVVRAGVDGGGRGGGGRGGAGGSQLEHTGGGRGGSAWGGTA
jgi:hypothetical protein